MTLPKTKTAKTANAIKSSAWLVEASWRGLVGWVLLANFSHFLAIAAAWYALATAAVIVVYHFFNAHK